MKVELIYFEGCPNAEEARTNLRRALEGAGVETEATEWEQGDPDAPGYVRDYGSPTVLVDGEDVTGRGAAAGGPACRADGAPSAETIQAAFTP